jgi:hypothetical protein
MTTPFTKEEWALPFIERLQIAAIKGLKGRLPVPLEPNHSVQFVQVCFEAAMGLRPDGFYSLVLGGKIRQTPGSVEDELVKLHPHLVVFSNNALMAGDIGIWRHLNQIGIMTWFKNELWVAQNTTHNHGLNAISQLKFPSPYLRLVKIREMGLPSAVIRFDV